MKRLVTLILFSLLMTPTALAHDHRPPPAAVLTVGSHQQDGRKVHSNWTHRIDRRFCEMVDTFYWTTFPRAIASEPGLPASVRLRKAAAPLEWWVYAWRRVDRRGRPQGNQEIVPADVEPRVRAGEITGWDLRFVPPLVEGHLYLLVEVYWSDEEGCFPPPDLGSQTASWTFHLSA